MLFTNYKTSFHPQYAPFQYCYRCGNVAAIMTIDDTLEISDSNFKIFHAVPEERREAPARAAGQYFL
jgi:serine/threonine-protein phosphatase PP1-1/serine/threonine-protein phosphatase 6 catalytic subunit